ncbi:MAG TPA: hypothetical protein VMQ86_25605 [Bryobacteraceae bacterium]|jgi:hypothetical protein|nr:hypothetical protein [Bryobacteraceae bacterium]
MSHGNVLPFPPAYSHTRKRIRAAFEALFAAAPGIEKDTAAAALAYYRQHHQSDFAHVLDELTSLPRAARDADQQL